jgi:dihydrodipicolinate reductase
MNNKLHISFTNLQYGNSYGSFTLSLLDEQQPIKLRHTMIHRRLFIKMLNDLINYLQENNIFNVTAIQNKLILNYLHTLLRLMRQINQ